MIVASTLKLLRLVLPLHQPRHEQQLPQQTPLPNVLVTVPHHSLPQSLEFVVLLLRWLH